MPAPGPSPDSTFTWLFSLLLASDVPPTSAAPFPLSGPAKGTHSTSSYFRRNLFHMCLIHLRLLKFEISSVQNLFQLFFSPCPFLETGSCVWLRTNSSSAPGTYKMFGMRNGEVWGSLLYSLLSWGKCASARDRLGSSWGWKTSQNFPVSPC